MSTYQELGVELGKLVDAKQRAYSDSFGRAGGILKIFYPDGVSPDQYDDMLAIVRIIDKLFRIAAHGSHDPMDESPFMDIAGYGLLGWQRHQKSNGPTTEIANKDLKACVEE